MEVSQQLFLLLCERAKASKRFDVQSTLGAASSRRRYFETGTSSPVKRREAIPHWKFFWPEIENNATFYPGGPNDGRVQNFVTPGLMLGKSKLEHDPRNRLALVIGGGMQIATPQFHTDNQGPVLTARMLF